MKTSDLNYAVFLLAVLGLCFEGAEARPKVRGQRSQSDKKPYKFGFRTPSQHRTEKKQDDGTIQGEFGYATADGFYLTTVYATDVNGKFVVLERRKEAIADILKRQGKSLEPEEEVSENDINADSYYFNYTSVDDRPVNEHRHEEHGFKDGSKTGSYWWDGPDGFRHEITYNASDLGGFMTRHRKILLEEADKGMRSRQGRVFVFYEEEEEAKRQGKQVASKRRSSRTSTTSAPTVATEKTTDATLADEDLTTPYPTTEPDEIISTTATSKQLTEPTDTTAELLEVEASTTEGSEDETTTEVNFEAAEFDADLFYESVEENSLDETLNQDV